MQILFVVGKCLKISQKLHMDVIENMQGMCCVNYNLKNNSRVGGTRIVVLYT